MASSPGVTGTEFRPRDQAPPAQILNAMREQGLARAVAAARARVQRADISRICKVDLDRFTIDRLVRIPNRLGRRDEVIVRAAEPGGAAEKVAAQEAA
jgi:predicted XRE-type DNA-binding protein